MGATAPHTFYKRGGSPKSYRKENSFNFFFTHASFHIASKYFCFFFKGDDATNNKPHSLCKTLLHVHE